MALPRVLVAAGFLLVEAVKVARSQDADILLIDSDNSEASCERELSGRTGSTALALSAAASCPVCVVPPQMTGCTGPFERMLVAVDLSSDPAPLRGLLNYAARLAVREGAELHVLHAQPHLAHQCAQIPSETARSIAYARERLAGLCRGLPGADRIAFVVSQGTACLEILKSAAERKADLLIVDRRGNDAGEKLSCVLEGAQCPLLLLRPCTRTYMESI
jgi:nucleotide-binding universal stress UspA family protein